MNKAKLCLEALAQGNCQCGNPRHVQHVHDEVASLDDETAEQYVMEYLNCDDIPPIHQHYVNSVLEHYGYKS